MADTIEFSEVGESLFAVVVVLVGKPVLVVGLSVTGGSLDEGTGKPTVVVAL